MSDAAVEPEPSRKDVALGVIASFGVALALAKAAEGSFDKVFWAAVIAVAAAIAVASDKRTPVCGALLFLSIRFAFAFLTTLRPSALLGALLSAGACVAFSQSGRRE